MKQWEDIIKERLDGYESTLPEGSFADFQKLRADAKAARRKKVYPLAWAAAAAVAASLAAVLFLRQPAQPEGGVRLVEQPASRAEVLALEEVTEATSEEKPARREPRKETKEETQEEALKETWEGAQEEALEGTQGENLESKQNENQGGAREGTHGENLESKQNENQGGAREELIEVNSEEYKEDPVTALQEEPFIPTGSPFIPEKRPARKVNIKVAGPVAGGVLGTSALGFLVASFSPGVAADAAWNQSAAPEPGIPFSPIASLPDLNMGVNPEDQDKLLDSRHSFPLRLEVSARIPVWSRLYLITGLEYSRYSSQYTSRLSGEHGQVAQYLGIPLRLDWVFPLGKRFDAYAGAGMQADFCLAAAMDGNTIRGDRPALSLAAAGGVQLNLAPYVGLFMEPQLSWRIPMGDTVLQTYRTQHPWMFSLAAGVRINIEKRP